MEPELVDALSEREIEILRLIAEGLSNREVAERLYLSPETIKWYNRQIYDKLGVDNRTKAAAVARRRRLLEGRAGGGMPRSDQPFELPVQLTSFVGRQTQLAEVRQRLEKARLVTLTGPGGAGKTRLALRVASLSVEGYRDGAGFVDLAAVRDPAAVTQDISAGLRLYEIPDQSATETLVRFFRDKHLLLVIDNFEQVIEAAATLNSLLKGAPELSLLVTSRESMRLSGEHVYRVPPLDLPSLDSDPQSLASHPSDAMTLFVQRARAVKPDFTLSTDNAQAVARICHRLDGLPLAIELAAARISMFGPRALLERIEDTFDLLTSELRDTPERQRSLHATMTWSYALLGEAEKTLLARLAVFQGGRTIDAVQSVCSPGLPIDVLDGLASLVNKSLLRTTEDPSEEPRFVMLETVHTFASDLLQSSGEMDEMRRRHASYFVDFVERAAPELRGGGQQMTWMRALESEHANLRAALRWAFEQGEFEVGQRLVAGLGNFWHRQGHWSEGERWVALALERVDMAPKDLQAAVYFAAGSVAFSRRDPGHGQRMFHRAKELYRELGARRMLGWSMVLLAVGSVGNKAEYEEATETCQEGMRLLREVGDMSGLAQGYNAIGELSRAVGKSEQAKSAYLKTLDIAREMGDSMRVAMNLCNLSFLALEEGDARRARRLLLEGMRVFDDLTSRPHLICSLASQSGSLAALGEFDRAAKLLGASDQLLERYGLTLQPADVPVIEAYRRAVITGMSDEAYAAAYEAGRTLSLEEAMALAEDTAKH